MAGVYAAAWRDWRTGLYVVCVLLKMPAVCDSFGVVDGVSARAKAVVDDFGDLVAVGALS